MSNPHAAKFLKELFACFTQYKVNELTQKVYLEKLSRWKLSPREWDGALDRIVADVKLREGALPQLSEIYPYLKGQSAATAGENDYGFMSFDLGKHRVSIRVKYSNGDWVSIKTGSVPVIPIDAANVKINMDKVDGIHTEAA